MHSKVLIVSAMYAIQLLWSVSARQPLYAQQQRDTTRFVAAEAPERIRNLLWTHLATDPAGDGRRSDFQDGKALHYARGGGDTLWFRLDVHGEVNTETPAVSISIDTDADQATGVNWYGSNRTFTFDKMVSVGPRSRTGAMYQGYNGVTNADGVRRRDWINEREGNAVFHYDTRRPGYIVGFSLAELGIAGPRIAVIGSVGGRATWNDDLIDGGSATIELTPAAR